MSGKRTVKGPLWPLAWEAGKHGGRPFFASFFSTPVEVVIVSIDDDGVLVELHREPSAARAVRWCLRRCLRVYAYLHDAIDALQRRDVRAWIDGYQVQVMPRGAAFRVRSKSFDLSPLMVNGELGQEFSASIWRMACGDVLLDDDDDDEVLDELELSEFIDASAEFQEAVEMDVISAS